jgi:hypothetical protein
MFAPVSGRAGRAIGTALVEVQSDCSGWQMSIEMVGPERSNMTIMPTAGRLATIMTNAMTAASCRIEVRPIVSEVAIE